MKAKEAIALIEEKLPKKRFDHSLRVADTAVKLAKKHDGDVKQAKLAGILHDYCKYDELSDMYQVVRKYELENDLLGYGGEILHGPVCAAVMKHDFGIDDEEILLAIKNHTTGRQNMTKNEKIIFIADYIEPGRTTLGVDDIREMAFKTGNLDHTIYEISKRTVLFLIEKDISVYKSTIECLNYYNLNAK
ncbi:bis(5'-nucleosyl)-tetraphosphatase (symmetrical) YqeK [Staphylococcus massiliensis]|uniref:bis(5'-nucleosyl)-tetraphosphatase (symmetrical) YqeK n=1 Tax=Staphylococcus massiliensis TaxID=555791 RepID=UPI001EDF7255|nr:bis(5'-nucleosyl)-tetraphosphatase (symmetrical) YqeK [Staphylococcus massiliensis]MCG3400966.1 bis(5'-nucleosyl)-tetraphosphatase (symmetrical) YqeK [Staphylococcus massiliensis]